MPPVNSRRAQYSEATRSALLDSAAALFAEHGFAGTALTDVATTAQVTRGAVYHHFENKQALFRSVFENLEVAAMTRSQDAYDSAADPLEGALVALNTFLDMACEPVYSEIVWRQGPIALGWAEWKRCEEQFAVGMLERIIKALIDSGRIQPVPVATTAQLAFSLLGGAGMAIAEADDADRPQVKSECLTVMGMFISGLTMT